MITDPACYPSARLEHPHLRPGGGLGLPAGGSGIAPAASFIFAGNDTLDSRITFSRGAHATLVDSAGKIIFAPSNMLIRSQEFDNVAYTKAAATIAANVAVAPDGTLTADKLCEDGTSANHEFFRQITAVVGVRYAISVYAKRDERSMIVMRCDNLVNSSAWFDLAAGTVGTVLANATATIADAGNGWYRCTIFVTATSTVHGFEAYTAIADASSFYQGTTGQGVFVWGAQIEPVTYQMVPGKYNATGASEYYGARFDYSPASVGTPQGLLIEEQRTNLQTSSAALNDDNVWGVSAAAITADAVLAPDGTPTADKLIADNTNGTHRILTFNSITVTNGAAYSISIFAKAAGETQIRLTDNANAGCYFDLAAGTVGAASGGVTAAIEAFPNGWYRCKITVNAATTANRVCVFVARSGATTFTGNATDGVFLWGAQLEAGAFATSYIPTAASQVNRPADGVSITGSAFSSWFNAAEGTLLAEYSMPVLGGNRVPVYIRNGGDTNLIGIFVETNIPKSYVWNGGQQAGIANAAISAGVVHRTGITYRVNDFAAVTDGGTVGPDTAGSVPADLSQLDIGRAVSQYYLNGHVRSLDYYNRRLANAELRTLTA